MPGSSPTKSSGKAVIFDAPDHTVGPLLDEANAAVGHHRPLADARALRSHCRPLRLVTERVPSAQVLIHRLGRTKTAPAEQQFLPLPFSIAPRKADGYVCTGQELQLGFTSRGVHPHAGPFPGHVMYHFPTSKC